MLHKLFIYVWHKANYAILARDNGFMLLFLKDLHVNQHVIGQFGKLENYRTKILKWNDITKGSSRDAICRQGLKLFRLMPQERT